MTPCRRPCWTAGRWLRSRTSGAASTRLRNGCSVSRQRPRNDPLCSVSYPIAVNGRIASGQRSPELGSTTDFPRAPWLLTFNSESFPKHYAGKAEMNLYIRNFWKDTQGQDLVEYALAAGMVAVAAVAAMPQLSTVVNNVFSKIGSIITSAVS